MGARVQQPRDPARQRRRHPLPLALATALLAATGAAQQNPTAAPTSARDPVADQEQHDQLFSGDLFTQTDKVEKYKKHFYVLDSFALGTECRIVHDECLNAKFRVKMETCYGKPTLYGQILGWPQLVQLDPGYANQVAKPPKGYHPHGFKGSKFSSAQLDKAGLVEKIPLTKLEHMWYYWMVYGLENSTYKMTVRCESESCPWSQPSTYIHLPGKTITKVGDTSAAGFQIVFDVAQGCPATWGKKCVQPPPNITNATAAPTAAPTPARRSDGAMTPPSDHSSNEMQHAPLGGKSVEDQPRRALTGPLYVGVGNTHRRRHFGQYRSCFLPAKVTKIVNGIEEKVQPSQSSRNPSPGVTPVLSLEPGPLSATVSHPLTLEPP